MLGLGAVSLLYLVDVSTHVGCSKRRWLVGAATKIISLVTGAAAEVGAGACALPLRFARRAESYSASVQSSVSVVSHRRCWSLSIVAS